MDWRHPNLACLFHKEVTAQNQDIHYTRYARAIKNPPLYGLTARDYETDQRFKPWPGVTEYQDAFCSNYRDLKSLQCDVKPKEDLRGGDGSLVPTPRGGPVAEACEHRDYNNYKISDVMPLAALDKHYRGARYYPDDPIGTIVPEELSKRRETIHGPVRLSCQQDLKNVFLPNYRYKDWVSRPTIECSDPFHTLEGLSSVHQLRSTDEDCRLYREMDSDNLFCRLPEAPTKYWDFYNTIRMRRPARKSAAVPEFQPCQVLPIPINKEVPDLPDVSANPYFGKFNNYQTSVPAVGLRKVTAQC